MPPALELQEIDWVLFGAANLVNFLLGAMFLARARSRQGASRCLGLASLAAGLPILAVPVVNALGGREWVRILLPLPYAAHWFVELVLDYVLRSDFRSGRLLGPYLGLFYLGQIGLIGYAFSMGREHGFAMLGTYLFCLAATGYSFRRVGHGLPAG